MKSRDISKEKILFVCSQNKLRSKTAEAIFNKKQEIDVKSAGTDNDAALAVNSDLIKWADTILVMEQSHKNKLRKKFKKELYKKRLIILNIPDEYDFMDPDLINLLKQKLPKLVV